jgi:hypothetical protein
MQAPVGFVPRFQPIQVGNQGLHCAIQDFGLLIALRPPRRLIVDYLGVLAHIVNML